MSAAKCPLCDMDKIRCIDQLQKELTAKTAELQRFKDSSFILSEEYHWQTWRGSSIAWADGSSLVYGSLKTVKASIEDDKQWREQNKSTPVLYRIVKTTSEVIN